MFYEKAKNKNRKKISEKEREKEIYKPFFISFSFVSPLKKKKLNKPQKK